MTDHLAEARGKLTDEAWRKGASHPAFVARVGRPPVPSSRKLEHRISVSLCERDRRRVSRAASSGGVSDAEFVRAAVQAALDAMEP